MTTRFASESVAELVREAESQGLRVELAADGSILVAPKARATPAIIERLRAAKPALIEYLKMREAALADALAAAVAELGWGAEDTRDFLRDDLPEIGVAAAIEVIKALLAHERALRSQIREGAR